MPSADQTVSPLALPQEAMQLLNSLYTQTAKLKIDAVAQYVDDLLEGDSKFIIFAHHTDLLDGIEKAVRKKKVRSAANRLLAKLLLNPAMVQ